MDKALVHLNPAETERWYETMKGHFARAGFGDGAGIPFYACEIPGEKKNKDLPRPPLLMPVVKPSKAFLAEHGSHGRYDPRSNWTHIPSFEQIEGLEPDNGVFQFEFFDFSSHFNVNVGGIIADEMIAQDFSIGGSLPPPRKERRHLQNCTKLLPP